MIDIEKNGNQQEMPLGSGTAQLSSTSEQSALSFGTGISQDPLSYSNPPTHQTLGGIGVAGYSAFPSAAAPSDGSWTATTFDPSIMGGFGFTGPNMLTPNQGFFFPSTDVWGQTDPLMMNNSWLLSPVPLEQPQIPGAINLGVSTDGTTSGSTLEQVTGGSGAGIDQTFNSLTLNGSGNGSILPIGGGSSETSTTTGGTTQPLISGGTTPPQVMPTSTVESTGVTTTLPNPPQDTKPKSWAAIASQPAKPKPPPPKPAPQLKEEPPKKQGSGSGGPSRNNSQGMLRGPGHQSSGGGQIHQTMSSTGNYSNVNGNGLKRNSSKGDTGSGGSPKKMIDVVSKLKSENMYNPSELTLNLNTARYFVIKSYAEDDVHRSIKYNVWCSTEHGNRRLDTAFKEQKAKGGSVYLFFSVNGSGHFCGVAKMVSEVDLCDETGIWTQDKWKGKFDIKWIYIKDVPNGQLRHIRLENNENKPVTNSRDTQEVPLDKGKMVMKVIHAYSHTTSIFDDFEHYEKRQEEETLDNEQPMTTNTISNRKVCSCIHLHMYMYAFVQYTNLYHLCLYHLFTCTC